MPLFLEKEEKRGVVTVMFDDRERLVIRKKDFEKYPLQKDEEVDVEEYMNAVAGFQAPEAYEAALSLLDYSARTENEMKKKLRMKGYIEMVIESVIERLKDARLVDDRQLAERIAENASERGIGAYALKRKLKTRGISEDDVEYASSLMDEEKEKEIIKDINEKSPDILFVCLGFPKQERWIDSHSDISARIAMGIGGSLDVFAGEVKRAPEFFQKAGLEWFYRLIKQPSRFVRMLALPKFGVTVLFHGKKFLK